MQLVGIAETRCPAVRSSGAFEGYDGNPMRFARWEPTRGPARGTVCVFTGRSEFIEKYFEVVSDLRRRGFAVAVMDWRGQGGSYRPLSNPRKGWVRSFSEYDRDLDCFMEQVVKPNCPTPYYRARPFHGRTHLAPHCRPAGFAIRAHHGCGAHAPLP